ncbi:MAG: F0F1 ATP synthase subunit A [Ruminococcus sp.]|nr:F0F1 ATP synthase subunit A [Ruminococcus sp.]
MDGVGQGPKVVFEIFGWHCTETVVMGWLVIAIVFILCKVLTSNLKKVPETKRQVIAEMMVKFVNNTVRDNMGPDMMVYAPYIGALLLYALLGSLISLVGLRSVTADFNTTFGMAAITFMLITYTKIKHHGVGGYLKGFCSPIGFMLPLNIISEIATPASMAFRLFGNIAGGMVISGLLYGALGSLSQAIGLSFAAGSWGFNVFQVGIPAVLSVYFDLFSGTIQAYIFSMLTMVNVAAAKD